MRIAKLLLSCIAAWLLCAGAPALAQECLRGCDPSEMNAYGCCPAAPPPVIVAPRVAVAACPTGMEKGPDTAGNCCWPGQAWNGARCVGKPSSCPVGFVREGDACEIPSCAENLVRMTDGVHCCWPNQAWSSGQNRCVGTPSCPQDYIPKDNYCIEDPAIIAKQKAEERARKEAAEAERQAAQAAQAKAARLAKARSRVHPVLERHGMAKVGPGTFTMGCQGGGCDESQRPVEVKLSQGVFSMASEVSQGLYDVVMGENPTTQSRQSLGGVHAGACSHVAGQKLGGDNNPVVCVTWRDAAIFANRLSTIYELTPAYTIRGDTVSWNRQADGWRLPTEAEWEYLARAGGSYLYSGAQSEAAACSAGNVYADGDRAALGANRESFPCDDRSAGLASIKSFNANGWGLYDMTGNAWEWTWDVYEPGDRRAGKLTDPAGPATGAFRSLRGGSWLSSPATAPVANRYGVDPDRRSPDVGFRLVRNAGMITVTTGVSGAAARPARLELSSSERTLSVLMDEQPYLLPVGEFEVPAGRPVVTVWDPRFHAESHAIDVGPGESASLELVPRLRTGEITVSAPGPEGDYGAKVRVDGEVGGATPWTGDLAVGDYEVRIGWEPPVQVEAVDYEPRALNADGRPKRFPRGSYTAMTGGGLLLLGIPVTLGPHNAIQASQNSDCAQDGTCETDPDVLTPDEISSKQATRAVGYVMMSGGLVAGGIGLKMMANDRAQNTPGVAVSHQGITVSGRF